MNKISFVLPCRNEKQAIKEVIQDIKSTCKKRNIKDYEIIVSDSSWDGSSKIAKKQGAKVIKHNQKGYGVALRKGINQAKYETIVFGDPDGTYNFKEFPKLIKKLKNYDIVLGNRLKGEIEKSAMPFTHRFIGTPLLNLFLNIFFPTNISDSQSGFRAFKKESFEKLNLATNGMEFASEMIIQAVQKNLKIIEIPIDYKVRKGNSSLKPYKDGLAHLKYIILKAPFIFYAIIGGIITILGILSLLLGSQIGWLFKTATFKIFFPIIGLQIIFLGLFSKTYLYTKLNQENKFLKRFYQIFSLKHAILIGGIFLLVPIIFKIIGLGQNLFDPLLVEAILGIQIIFNSIYLSELSIK